MTREEILKEALQCVTGERLILMEHTPGLLPLWIRTATPPVDDQT